MALTEDAAKQEAKDALDRIVDRWVNNQKDAITEVHKNLPQINGLDPLFKKAAVLGAGMKATQVLFPDSGLTGAIGRLSLPIALASFAMSGFKKLYEKETQRSVNFAMNAYKITYQDSAKRKNNLLNNTVCIFTHCQPG